MPDHFLPNKTHEEIRALSPKEITDAITSSKEIPGVQAGIEWNARRILEAHGVSEGEALNFANIMSQLNPATRLAMIQTLIPEAFTNSEVQKLHAKIETEYPELMSFIQGTPAYYTCFPQTGIIQQSNDIKAKVSPQFDAGIGVAKTPEGDILVNGQLRNIFDGLQPEDISDNEWQKIANTIFNYNAGTGALWYREIAKYRYADDEDPERRDRVKKALRIAPMPSYGGSAALDTAFDIAVGRGTPIICPSTYWGNINLKADHKGAFTEKCDYIDTEGKIHPESLKSSLREMKERGFSKASVYFNFPHNPTGTFPTEVEAQQLANVIQEMADEGFQISVICDEPYYPFVRGKNAAKAPFSHFMTPGENRNILTFVNINGTKRDGMYGIRHADLIVLTPETISDEGVKLFSGQILAGFRRGSMASSDALSQYLLAWAMTNDPKIPLRKPDEIRETLGSRMISYALTEAQMIDYMNETVNRTIQALEGIEGLERVQGNPEIDSAGGFFICYRVTIPGISAQDIHKAGLETNCGIIATSGYVRINGLIKEDAVPEFAQNLQKAVRLAKEKKEQ